LIQNSQACLIKTNIKQAQNIKFGSKINEDLIDHASLLESEILTLAHDENIEAWIESVERHLKLYPKVNALPKIAQLNDLTLAQTFVAALFGNFRLEQFGDFYEVDRLKLFR